MRSSSTSSAMRLSRSANTLYAIVPRWLALARRVPRRPRGRRRTCGSQERLRWQAALARGCQGPWRWRVALARVAPGGLCPCSGCASKPVPSGTAFAVASLTAKAALAGAGGPLRGTRFRSFSPFAILCPDALCHGWSCCCALVFGIPTVNIWSLSTYTIFAPLSILRVFLRIRRAGACSRR